MQKHTQEFLDMKKDFEMAVDCGFFGYVPSDFSLEPKGSTNTYANGHVESIFKGY